MRMIILFISLSMLVQACENKSSEPSNDKAPEPTTASTSDQSPAEAPTKTELEIPNKAEPIEGLITGAQPGREALESLDERGFSTVINLRTAGEFDAFDEREIVEKQGLTYVSIPIAGPEDLTRENTERLHETLESAPGKVLLHCGSSNRVGALLALRAHWLLDESVDEAMALGRSAGLTKLEPDVAEKLAKSSRAGE